MNTRKQSVSVILIALSIIMIITVLVGCSQESGYGQDAGQDITGDVTKDQDTPSQGLKGFNECLAENGMVIYGASTCPACRNLVELLGGYEEASPVYVECTQERQRCSQEARSGYVPEIQINGVLYQGQRSLESFAEVTGCPLV